MADSTCVSNCKVSASELCAASLRCLTLWTVLVPAVGCDSQSSKTEATHIKPATIVKLPRETELATVTLSPDAFQRLGIETQQVQQRSVSPRRLLGGEAIVPTGNTLIVTAPVPGIISKPGRVSIPLPGARIELGEPVLNLVPLLSPERDVPTPAEQVQLVGARANLVAAQVTAIGEIERSRVEVDAAKISLNRSEKLFQNKAGSRKAVDDATAQLRVAESVLQASMRREEQLSQLLKSLGTTSADGDATPLPLTAPISGILNRLDVSAGQTVGGGALLFEIVNLDTIWIRVPVFVDLLSSIEVDQSARLVSLAGKRLGNKSEADSGSALTPLVARPIVSPPTADARTSSADLYYEIDNRTLGLRPGQRIGVELPLIGASEARAVPSSAILYDIHGSTWVYVVSAERSFTRQRVSIRWIEGKLAILESGPKVGSQVVVSGAAELFGAEFGIGK